MKLYTKPGACSTADHIALQWTGAPFEVEVVSQRQLKEAPFLAINPAGSVPVIVDGEFILTQNAAIMGYIHDTHPQAGLGGDGSAQQRAEATRWLSFCNSDVHPSFTPLFAPGLFISGADHYDAIKQAARKRVRKHFETADARLGETGQWLAGFRSFADPYLFVMLGWATAVGIEWDDLEYLSAFNRRMREDAGVQAALQAEGIS